MEKQQVQPARKNGFQARPNQVSLIVFAFIVLVIVLLSSCAQQPTSAPCQPGEPGEYTCEGYKKHQISLSNVPEGISPVLVTIDDEKEKMLLTAKKQDTACIFMIAGDLEFRDQNGELVTSFDAPVVITYDITEADLKEFNKCQEELIEENIVGSAEEVSYLAIYFDKDIWKPFPEDTVRFDEEKGLLIVEATVWGDQPIGGGTQP